MVCRFRLLACAPISRQPETPNGSRTSWVLLCPWTVPRKRFLVMPRHWSSKATGQDAWLAVWPDSASSPAGPKTTKSAVTLTTPEAKRRQKSRVTEPHGVNGNLVWCWSTTFTSPVMNQARLSAGRYNWLRAIPLASPVFGIGGKTPRQVKMSSAFPCSRSMPMNIR